jgi:GntR family transcriptional regulator
VHTVYTQYRDMHSDIVVSQFSGRPMYLQIMDQIKQKIAVGDWAAGEEIPSIRQLAVSLQVSVITVKRAYLELEREGVIVTQHGKGSFVAPDPALSPRLYEEELAQHLDRAAELGTSLGMTEKEIVHRLRKAVDQVSETRLEKENS